MMKAEDVQMEDVYTDNSGSMWMVREVKRTFNSGEKIAMRLSAGRTDPGEWYEFLPEQPLDIYRRDA